MQAPSAGELEGGVVNREEALEWIARGKTRMLVERTLLLAAEGGYSSVRVFPAGRHVRVSGRKAGRSTLLLSLAGRHRRDLIGALAGFSGLSSIPAGLSETAFVITSYSIHYTKLYDPRQSSPVVDHREGVDPEVVQQDDGVLERVVHHCGDHLPRHA